MIQTQVERLQLYACSLVESETGLCVLQSKKRGWWSESEVPVPKTRQFIKLGPGWTKILASAAQLLHHFGATMPWNGVGCQAEEHWQLALGKPWRKT